MDEIDPFLAGLAGARDYKPTPPPPSRPANAVRDIVRFDQVVVPKGEDIIVLKGNYLPERFHAKHGGMRWFKDPRGPVKVGKTTYTGDYASWIEENAGDKGPVGGTSHWEATMLAQLVSEKAGVPYALISLRRLLDAARTEPSVKEVLIRYSVHARELVLRDGFIIPSPVAVEGADGNASYQGDRVRAKVRINEGIGHIDWKSLVHDGNVTMDPKIYFGDSPSAGTWAGILTHQADGKPLRTPILRLGAEKTTSSSTIVVLEGRS